MISILISSESRYPINRKKIRQKVKQVLGRGGIEDVEVSVSVVGDRKIRQLNRQYLKIDEPTDVLSFPLEEPRDREGILRLGDVVVSYPEAQKWAREKNWFVDEAILRLVEHGLLHLLGFKHDNGTEFKISTPEVS
jgi:probable rRNA maturation factor